MPRRGSIEGEAVPGTLTRRELGRLAAAGTASLALAACAAPRQGRRSMSLDRADLRYAPGGATAVPAAALPRGAGAEATRHAVRAVANAATDFRWLSRGDTVLIKPACNSGNAYPATTDPVALAAMIELLREKGAGRVIVADMSGVQFVRFSKDHRSGSTRALMEKNGMARSVRDAGGEVQAFEEAGWDGFFPDEPAPGADWSGPIWVPTILREVDHVVLMPRCARHLLAGSTLGLKAAVGWWRHDSRLEYHRDAGTFSEKTADANTLPAIRSRQRLVLTCATKVLTTFGPDQGRVVEPETGLVFGSSDVVAHDMVSLAWLIEARAGLSPAQRDGLLDDPNTSPVFVNVANRVVVQWLGGLGQMLRTQRLGRYDLETIWDDRVLRRAFQVFGGVPRIDLVAAEGRLPSPQTERLAAAVTLPA
jgi:uncharacterized protein (DUF362 family)